MNSQLEKEVKIEVRYNICFELFTNIHYPLLLNKNVGIMEKAKLKTQLKHQLYLSSCLAARNGSFFDTVWPNRQKYQLLVWIPAKLLKQTKMWRV